MNRAKELLKKPYCRNIILVTAVALIAVSMIYFNAFPYADTEKGRLQAVADLRLENIQDREEAQDMCRIIACWKEDNQLIIYYGINNDYNEHGILYMTRGLNGRYRTLGSNSRASHYTAGVEIWPYNEQGEQLIMTGENCQEIKAVGINAYGVLSGTTDHRVKTVEYPVTQTDFLEFIDGRELVESFEMDFSYSNISEIHFLDEQGNDITENYRRDKMLDWGPTRSSAGVERHYIFIGIVWFTALLICVQMYLRGRERH